MKELKEVYMLTDGNTVGDVKRMTRKQVFEANKPRLESNSSWLWDKVDTVNNMRLNLVAG